MKNYNSSLLHVMNRVYVHGTPSLKCPTLQKEWTFTQPGPVWGLNFYIIHLFKLYWRLKLAIIEGVATLSDRWVHLFAHFLMSQKWGGRSHQNHRLINSDMYVTSMFDRSSLCWTSPRLSTAPSGVCVQMNSYNKWQLKQASTTYHLSQHLFDN